ncbi:MAG: universal stress protein [Planctomycetaceae bacterium]|uniref:Universal stress protein n=2 Tax=Lacipirellula limnantheis TaxID=2528024 RepID=A0A517TYU1_9BACT|nr:universal stress protein [Planctomycetaceae bacterium]QDT73532.1 Universal stress protein [Lacipirellula limnantheis]
MHLFSNCPIIVPIDMSPEGKRALDCAKQLTADASNITALHIYAPAPTLDPPYSCVYREVQEAVERHVYYYCKEYERDGIKAIVETGQSPSDCIVRYAEKVGAGLIVMPSHGRTGMNHMLIGSVAERVVRHARCPVLVLRGLSKEKSHVQPVEMAESIPAILA